MPFVFLETREYHSFNLLQLALDYKLDSNTRAFDEPCAP